MPATELFDRALREQILTSKGRPLTANDIHFARAHFINRWSEDEFADRNEARIAALEASRSRDYAHDLADVSPQLQALAFGDADVVEGRVTDRTADSDELLDADLADEAQEADDLIDLTGLAHQDWDAL